MNNKFDSIEKSICKELESLSEEAKVNSFSGDTEWTNSLKNRLEKLGKNFGYEVRPSFEKSSSKSEWLYDLVWLEMKNDKIKSIP